MVPIDNLCHNSGVLKALYIVKKTIGIMFSIGPAILIIAFTFYMIKSILYEDNINEKEIIYNFIKKVMLTASLFFVPLLTKAVFNLVGSAGVKYFECYNMATISNIEKYENEEKAILAKAKAEEKARKEKLAKEKEEREAKELAQRTKEYNENQKNIKSEGNSVINDKAIELSWPLGTSSSKYSYSKGNPTSAFKSAYQKYPYRTKTSSSKYGDGPRLGASCDRFVGTVIWASGYDKTFPSGLDSQWTHLAKSSKWKEISYNYNTSVLKPGDVVIYSRNSGGHILLIVEVNGQKAIAEAGLNSSYGHLDKSFSKLRKSSDKTKLKVYRPTN